MAAYIIDKNDIINIANHMNVALTKEQVAMAVEMYPTIKAENCNLLWNQIIEAIITEVTVRSEEAISAAAMTKNTMRVLQERWAKREK